MNSHSILGGGKYPVNQDVTILVNSCDKYDDAWNPFFTIFKHQWPDCPYEFVLNTESKEFQTDLFNVRTVHPISKGNITWSRRFREALHQIQTEYVLFILEDYFILNPVNTEVFYEAVKVMKRNSNVGSIVLCQTNREGIKTKDYEDDNFYSRVIDAKNKVWCRIVLYRKEYLLRLIRDFETIWNFEWYATFRAKRLNYLMLQQNNRNDEVFTFKVALQDGLGISGKWLKGNVELFQRHNILVDFNRLGFRNIENELSQEKKTDKNKFDLREFLYYLCKKLPKKAIKYILKVRHYF